MILTEVLVVNGCEAPLLTTIVSSSHNQDPSSELVLKAYSPVATIRILAVHRTPKVIPCRASDQGISFEVGAKLINTDMAKNSEVSNPV